MSAKIICSTGTVTHRALLDDHKILIRLLDRLDSDEFEFIIYPVWYDRFDTLLADLKATGKKFPIIHSEKMIGSYFASGDPEAAAEGMRRLEIACRAANVLGAGRIVLHLWELPDSDDAIANNFAALPACLKLAEHCGVILSVETIPCRNSDPLELLLGMDRANPDAGGTLSFTMDTQHLGFHGQNELLLDPGMKSFWERKAAPIHFHIRDYSGGPFNMETFKRSLHPGEGEIDLPDIFARMRASESEHLVTLEASGLTPEKTVDTAKINGSLKYLRDLARG